MFFISPFVFYKREIPIFKFFFCKNILIETGGGNDEYSLMFYLPLILWDTKLRKLLSTLNFRKAFVTIIGPGIRKLC